MNKFIISTDLYETSDSNIYTSYHFAKALGLRPALYFVDSISPMIEKTFHASSIQTNYVLDPVWKKQYEITVLKKVSQQLRRLSLDKSNFDFEVFEGSISDGIQHLKHYEKIQMISVGASDHGEIRRLFFNTFAEKVFFNLEKRCLIVKKREKEFKNIYLLLNPIELDDKFLEQSVDLIKKLKAKLHIICVVDVEFLGLNLEAFPHAPSALQTQAQTTEMLYKKTESRLQELESKLRQEDVEIEHTTHVTLNKESSDSLNLLLQDIHPHLVIMSPRSHFLGHFSIGSITHHIMKTHDFNFYLIP